MPTTTPTALDYVGCLAGNLRAATRAVTRVYDDALRPHGLRLTQVAVLSTLRATGPVGVTELAAAVGTERSAVARELRPLAADGLVTVAADADDGRVRRVKLTPRGADRLDAAAPAWHRAQDSMRVLLGVAEVEALVRAASAVVDALSRDDA
ncbi:MarR family winged helix-turn-helix transcriptional regulator [Phycicoccus avicenniae]|uniref:MarR family winged helix-turn-helix transcriptional regulator n=1 Tax=Phycicoccus avicenniae TaxID=2828860 RepID=UPI003D2BD68D